MEQKFKRSSLVDDRDKQADALKIREPTQEERKAHWLWLSYAFELVAASAYSQLSKGGMVLVRKMNPLIVEYWRPEQVRKLGTKQSEWMDLFDREKHLLMGFVTDDGMLVTYMSEGVGDGAPGSRYRALYRDMSQIYKKTK